MTLSKFYVNIEPPQSKKVLWIKPLLDGFALYIWFKDKWQLLKVLDDNGTPIILDDITLDFYIKEEIDSKFADILGLDAAGIAELKALIEDEDSLTGLLSEINNKADKTELENVAYTNAHNRFTASNYFRYGDSDTAVLINNGGISVFLASNENLQWCEIKKDNIVFCDTGIGQIAFKPILNNGTVRLAGGVNHANYKPLAYLEDVNGKQDTLVSGTNIKTVNSASLLGSGDISVGTITGITMNGASKGTSGVVNLGTVLTSTTSSVTSGGLLPITSGGVYTALQSYEKKVKYLIAASSTIGYDDLYYYNTYFIVTLVENSYTFILPINNLSNGVTICFQFTTGSNFTGITWTNGTRVFMKDFNIQSSKTYEVVALYVNSKWLITATEFE